MHTSRGLLADIQFSGNGGKGQDIVIAVCHLVRDKLLVPLANGVIAAVVDKHITFEGRLLVGDDHARRKAAMGSLDIPIAVVDANDNRIATHKVHSSSFLPLCGCEINCLCTALYGKCPRCTVPYKVLFLNFVLAPPIHLINSENSTIFAAYYTQNSCF